MNVCLVHLPAACFWVPIHSFLFSVEAITQTL